MKPAVIKVGLGTTMVEPGLTGGRLDGIGVYTRALMQHLPATLCEVAPFSWPRPRQGDTGITIGQAFPVF